MGKARRKLKAARKEVSKAIIKQYGNKSYGDSNNYFISKKVDQRDPKTMLADTAWELRKTLFEYVDDMAYPLCEYLDMTNTINFVEWVLR